LYRDCLVKRLRPCDCVSSAKLLSDLAVLRESAETLTCLPVELEAKQIGAVAHRDCDCTRASFVCECGVKEWFKLHCQQSEQSSCDPKSDMKHASGHERRWDCVYTGISK
jgi:hypothetical protein